MKTLAGGQSWIREGRQFRCADSSDLEQIRTRVERKQSWAVKVGFDDQAECGLLELDVPDTSNSPSARAKHQIGQSLDWKGSIQNLMGTVNTHIARLLHVQKHGIESEFDPRGMETLTDLHDKIGNEDTKTDSYYFFEEQALKLNLTICNKDTEDLEDVCVELAFPRTHDFDVVDRLYAGPDDKRTPLEIEMADYPEVRRGKNAAVAHASLGHLAPNRPQQVFNCALRLAVGPTMAGKKVAISYRLRARNKHGSGRGRIKIKFA